MAVDSINKSNNTEAIKQGLNLIINNYSNVLTDLKITKIDTNCKKFNHNYHNAIEYKVSDDIELLDLIQYPVIKTYENVIDELTTKDRIFLENFIEGGIVKKNKDVAKKLGISSQAVSAKKKIKEKIRKNAKLKEEKICLF